jgi:hypothetical protein
VSSRSWAATVFLTCLTGALASGILRATIAAAILVAVAILAAIWFVIDPWVRRLLDKWIPDLKVTIEQKDWENFRYQALILEMKVGIKDRKNKRKRLTGFTFQHQGGGIPADFDIEVQREVYRRSQTHPSLRNNSIIEPGATVSGWMVYALPLRQSPGEPAFTFSVSDELDVEYEARQR